MIEWYNNRMAKTQSLNSLDLHAPGKKSMAQRGSLPASDHLLLQFKLNPEVVKTFKFAALEHNMKLNQFFIHIFESYQKRG